MKRRILTSILSLSLIANLTAQNTPEPVEVAKLATYTENPELVGKVARVPIAYRMCWDDGKIQQWYIYFDMEYLKAQRGVE